jgi:hypothetical protein
LGEIAYVFAPHDLSAIHAGFCGGVRAAFERRSTAILGLFERGQKGR